MKKYREIINKASEDVDLTEGAYIKARDIIEETFTLMASGSVEIQAAAYCLSQYPLATWEENEYFLSNYCPEDPDTGKRQEGTMATDGIRIYFNPFFVNYLWDNEHVTQLTTILCHELGHCMLLHPAITLKSAGLLARRGITPNPEFYSYALNLMYDRIVDDFSQLGASAQSKYYIDPDFADHHSGSCRDNFDSLSNYAWESFINDLKHLEAEAFCGVVLDAMDKHTAFELEREENTEIGMDDLDTKFKEIEGGQEQLGNLLVTIFGAVFSDHRKLSSFDELKHQFVTKISEHVIAGNSMQDIEDFVSDPNVLTQVIDDLDNEALQDKIEEPKNRELLEKVLDPDAYKHFMERSMGIYDSLDDTETKNVVMAMFEHVWNEVVIERPEGRGPQGTGGGQGGDIHVIIPPEALKKDGSGDIDASLTEGLSADINEQAAQVAQQCQKIAGVTPLGMKIPMPDIDPPTVPLSEKFKQAIPGLRTKASMIRTHAAFASQRIMIPSREQGEPSIIMALDTSGSVVGSPDELRQLMSEVMGALNGAGLHKIHFYCWDTDFYGPTELVVGEVSPDIVLAGCGGTDATPVYNEAIEHFKDDRNVVGMVILTDGYIHFEGNQGDLPPHWQLVWLLSDSGSGSEFDQFGEVIML